MTDPLLDHLAARAGHRFADAALAWQAFTHSSYAHERPGSSHNERLEFLGDAVVGLAVARMLLDERPRADEGELTNLRQRMVSQEGLVVVCDHLDLARFVRLGGSVREKVRSSGSIEESIRGSLVEALAGALTYELPLDAVVAITTRWFQDVRERLVRLHDPKPSKNVLQELVVQWPGRPAPAYRVLSQGGPDHAPEFEVAVEVGGRRLAVGTGPSKKEAEKEAARLAVSILRHEAATTHEEATR
ncbi:MAG TPA: ribonuclease III [Myxococcota bacterium]|nr:ribonuclease III [Myxococcota bacterium]